MTVLITASASVPASMQRRAFSRMSVWLGESLVRDEARLGEIELRQDDAHHVVDARVLQPDGVQHPRRRLVHTVRRVAEARAAGRAL